MNTCLDEGMLQAYMDGELPGAQMEATAQHLAACATCAELAHEAEHEYALFSTAFAPVLSAPPPTERLRARLEDAIADLQVPAHRIIETPGSRLRAWWSALAASFAVTPRQAAAFASFLLAVALTVTLTALRQKQLTNGEQIAALPQIPASQPAKISTDSPAPQAASGGQVAGSKATGGRLKARAVRLETASYTSAARRGAQKMSDENSPAPPRELAPLLPDEKNYLRTIATLDVAIKAQGAKSLPPSLRAEYERNLALVDEQIIATRVAARRNPQSADAKEFLRAAYQNKVDLLTTVSDQTQFIAARD
ncbi:MAG TPA: zf-HC2 domain-containing protein [Pyrinomonadaceae bacterium]|jgi:hypothetical protein